MNRASGGGLEEKKKEDWTGLRWNTEGLMDPKDPRDRQQKD